jgi:glycine/D-amino acid oxidase-like deaminating enzyme
VPWAPDTLLAGATVEDVGFDERSTVDGVRELLDAVADLLPESRTASVADIRVGLRPSTADGLPLIGPLDGEPRIHMATGHYRNGVLLAPLTAKLVADAILPDPVS